MDAARLTDPRPSAAIRERRARRYTRLASLGFKSYSAYLASPRWSKVKALYRASDHPQDCICGETERVQLHHLTYERVGVERLSDLTPLCPTCHSLVHELERRGEMGLDFKGLVDAERAALYQWAERKRYQERFAASDRETAERQMAARNRSLCAQIRQVAHEARRNGVDLTPEFQEMDAIISRARAALT